MNIDKMISDLDRRLVSLVLVRDIQVAMNEDRVDDAIDMLPWGKAAAPVVSDPPEGDCPPTKAGPPSEVGEMSVRGKLIAKRAKGRPGKKRGPYKNHKAPRPCVRPGCTGMGRRSEKTGRLLTTCSPECGIWVKAQNKPRGRGGSPSSPDTTS